MTLYSRHQLLLLLLLVVAAGAGLAIDHWRRARPEAVERLEEMDRRSPAAPAAPADAAPRHPARRTLATPPLDLNRASAPELARLPGVGPALARRIVEARPFAALDDLARVRGLRPAARDRLRPLLALP
jgi:competence protein ComEA